MSPAPARGHHPWGLIWRLASADLRHEWILTLCLILAISAVIAPLLLLFGLKYGTIETLRQRLMNDPRNREIRPMASATFPREWFDEYRARADVGFLVPLTRQIAATVFAAVKGSDTRSDLDLVPTGPGDPLLLENGAPIPGSNEVVLTQFGAEALHAKIGQTLVVTATRLKGSQIEKGEVELKVAGILPVRAGAIKAMYCPLAVLERVEQFKDGQPVPEYGWPGAAALAYAVYDGVLIFLPAPLPRVEELQLCNNTGFTQIERLEAAALQERAGLALTTGKTVYLLFADKRTAGEDSLNMVKNRLRGKQAILMPWVRPLELEVKTAQGHWPVRGYALSMDEANGIALGLQPLPPWHDRPRTTDNHIPVLLPLDRVAESARACATNAEMALEFPVEALPGAGVATGQAYIPAQIAGVLRLFAARNLHYDEAKGEFSLYRRGYAAFRLYARSIDDVDGLRRLFDEAGIPVSTAAEEIQKVKEMDRYLTLIFWLVAVVGIAGSVASLVASLYASVERKKRELSVLRLLGLSGFTLFRFPVYQGALIAAGGYLVATGFFHLIATVINRLFQAHLRAGESFCHLPDTHQAAALACTVLLACLAALVAVSRLAHIEPAEALRDE